MYGIINIPVAIYSTIVTITILVKALDIYPINTKIVIAVLIFHPIWAILQIVYQYIVMMIITMLFPKLPNEQIK